jgi:hypothetical protein
LLLDAAASLLTHAEIVEVVRLTNLFSAVVLLWTVPAIANPTADIELWLGERVGRFGDLEFAILGGRSEFPTPTGAYQIEWKSRNWFSRQWQAPMPFAMFFCNGAAIHVGSLTGAGSHGCVRVSESTAKYLFAATREKETRVFVYP